MCYNLPARNTGFGVEAERNLPAMDYYARLLELYNQLAPDKKAGYVSFYAWLTAHSQPPVPKPEGQSPVERERPDAPVE